MHSNYYIIIGFDFVVALNYDHSENDCFACAFLTHGRQINNEDVMYGMDNYIYTKDILSPFKGDQCIYLS